MNNVRFANASNWKTRNAVGNVIFIHFNPMQKIHEDIPCFAVVCISPIVLIREKFQVKDLNWSEIKANAI